MAAAGGHVPTNSVPEAQATVRVAEEAPQANAVGPLTIFKLVKQLDLMFEQALVSMVPLNTTLLISPPLS